MLDSALRNNPALTVALALTAGTLAQALSRALGLPAIVLLLFMGVALGPEGLGLVHPASMGGGLLMLVGFAVAVILFEGGMNLNLRRMRREDQVIRRLVLLGAVVTAAGAAVSARFILGWDWAISSLFGTLVIVTGPTVITPLLRRLHVEHTTATVLEAEGVLIDAVGAIIATGAFEIVLSPTGLSFAQGVVRVALGLGLGTLVGVTAGFVMIWLLRFIPEELRNVLTLSLVLALFHTSNAFIDESGIAAVTTAGMVMGNRQADERREMFVFKEQLTLMFIGMLFVLLAADIHLANVIALGWRGLLVVATLMFVVRPLNVALSSYGTSLKRRQRVFIALTGPRGIVAAAMASLFAVELEHNNIPGGKRLRAMVFLVIAVTVVFAGTMGGPIAKWLNLRRASKVGWVLLGANDLARAVARALKSFGEEVLCIDTDPVYCRAAEGDGLRVLHANGLETRTLQRAAIETRAGAIGLAQTSEINLFFAQRVKEEAKTPRRVVALTRTRAQFSVDTATRSGASVLFGQPADLEHWNLRLRRGGASMERWRWEGADPKKQAGDFFQQAPGDLFLPMVIQDARGAVPVTDNTKLTQGAKLIVLANRERSEELEKWLSDSHLWFEEKFIFNATEVTGAYRRSNIPGSGSEPPRGGSNSSAPPASL